MSRKSRKQSIFSILNEEKIFKISSSRYLSWYFNAPSIRNKSINIIKKEKKDMIFRRLVKYDYTEYNDRIINSYIKVIYESRN